MVCALTVSAQLETPAPGVHWQSFLWPDHNLADPTCLCTAEQVSWFHARLYEVSLCLQIGKYVEVAATANTLCPNCQQVSMCALLASELRHLQSFCSFFSSRQGFCIIHARHWDRNGEIVIQSVPRQWEEWSAWKDRLFLIDPSRGIGSHSMPFPLSSYPVTWRPFLQGFFFFFFAYEIFQFPFSLRIILCVGHISDVVLGEVSSISSYSTLLTHLSSIYIFKNFIFHWSI